MMIHILLVLIKYNTPFSIPQRRGKKFDSCGFPSQSILLELTVAFWNAIISTYSEFRKQEKGLNQNEAFYSDNRTDHSSLYPFEFVFGHSSGVFDGFWGVRRQPDMETEYAFGKADYLRTRGYAGLFGMGR